MRKTALHTRIQEFFIDKLFDKTDTFRTGEALVAEEGYGNEIAHIDLLMGSKCSLGSVFCNTLARQSAGHSNLLAVIAPNAAAKPDTVLVTKVTIKNARQAVQMFGPAQTAVANAVNDAFLAKEFHQIITDPHEDLCIIAGVFIHWEAKDDQAILKANYRATRLAIRRALTGGPLADELEKAQESNLWHLFAGVPEGKSFADVMAGLRVKFAPS